MTEKLQLAYGLLLSSDFPLPGLLSHDATHGLEQPRLKLELCEQGLEPPGRAPDWRGRLGDGQDLSLWLLEGDAFFSYGRRAHFRLRCAEGVLHCSVLEQGADWQRALIGKVLPAVAVMLGYEALHAVALEHEDRVVAIAGPAGSGKSTLAAALLQRGWRLFADDQLTLALDAEGGVIAHCGTSHMNLDEKPIEGLRAEGLGQTLAVLCGERWMAIERVCTKPILDVGAVCTMRRGHGLAPGARRLPGNPLALAPYMLGLDMTTSRQRSRFDLYAELMSKATLVELQVDDEQAPQVTAEMLETALREERPVAGGLKR